MGRLICTGIIVWAGAGLAKPAQPPAMGCPAPPPPLALPASDGTGAGLSADQASLQGDIATAEGNVRLEQQGQALEAPYLIYDSGSSRVRARQGLKYYRPGVYLTAESADVLIESQTGEFNDASYSVITNGGRGEAAHVTSLGDGNYTLRDATYTTCSGENKAWLLSADRIELDRESGRGESFNSVLRFYGLPVFYSPYLNFPIDDKRHSGILAPTIGTSSDSGFELAVPYYFNLAPNYDATLIPRVLADRGLQLAGQFRYLGEHHIGEFDGAFLPSDRKYDGTRSLFHFAHVGRFNPYLGIEANFTSVSDDDYFDDLSTDLARTSQSQLERAVRLTFADTGVRFTLLAQSFDTLDNTDDDTDIDAFTNDPYKRLPQARLELLSPTAPFRAGLDAEFVNFERDDSINAYRSDLRPRILWGVDNGGWYANSEAAYRVTRYQFQGFQREDVGAAAATPDDVINRQIPSFSAEAGLRFIRTMTNGWTQTLEPRAFYLFNGYEDQSDIPVFDTGVADLHFERLFADNRFVGSDRIGDANQITLGATSRFIEPDSGRTVVKLDLGRVYGFRDLRVGLPGGRGVGYGETDSDYVAGAEYRPTRNIRAGVTAQYDPDDQELNRAIAQINWRNDGGYRLDLAYRRYRAFRPLRTTEGADDDINILPGQFETLEQTVVGFGAPLGQRVDVVGRWNYSLEKSQNVETLAGLEYRPSCCWAGRVAWRRYVADDDGSYDTAIMFQFVLNGLGEFGDTVRSFVDNDVFVADSAQRSAFDNIQFP